MRKSLALFVFFVVFLTLTGSSFASKLKVEKYVSENMISVGEGVEVGLKFFNPFGKPLMVRIKDKNVVAGNGLDIQCLEYKIPASESSVLKYSDKITAFKPGEFTLEPASVTYTNPETGAEEEVKSNEVKVKVEPSPAPQNVQQQGITMIYQCGGINMVSTSYSSTSYSSSIQISSSFGQTQTYRGIQQENQDIEAIKREMERRLKKREAWKRNVERIINQSEAFRNVERQLENEGYKLKSKTISAASNSSGSFSYVYQKGNELAEVKGRVENASVSELTKWSREDEKRLASLVENSTAFKQAERKLKKEGYTLYSKSFSFPKNNVSNFTYIYKKQGSKEKAIVGNATVDGKVISLRVKGEEEGFPWWVVVELFLILALLALAMFIIVKLELYKKIREAVKRRKRLEKHEKTVMKTPDFRADALSMVERAEKLFSEGREKEAYETLSRALKHYFKHVLSYGKKEMTSDEILKKLRGMNNKRIYKEARDFFNFCDLVNFARYKPRKVDFERMKRKGKGLILSPLG